MAELTNKTPLYLYEFIKKKVDLSEFLETEISCTLNWFEPGISAGTPCPLHKETQASFRLKYIEEDNIWIYNCFGCGASGTIIDFFMEYYSLANSAEAVIAICKKFGFKDSKELAISSLMNIKKRASFQKKIEFIHIVSSNQCRMLLKKDFNRYNKWVADAYKEMNKALIVEDLETVERIGSEASSKML